MPAYLNNDHVATNPLLNGSYEQTDAALGVQVTSITAAGFLGIMGSLVSLGTSGVGTMSQQAFAFGQVAVQGNPRNFLRLIWSTAATAGTPRFCHKIEDVRNFSGKKVTLQGFYRSNAAMPIQIRQDFGTGGSPSADVSTNSGGPINSIPSTVDADGTAQWRPFTLTYTLPSINGKTLGTTANTSYLGIDFMPALLTTLQFDVTGLRLIGAGEDTPIVTHRFFAEEERMLARYYQTMQAKVFSGGTSLTIPFGAMRAVPLVSGNAGSPFTGSYLTTLDGSNSGTTAIITGITLDARIAD